MNVEPMVRALAQSSFHSIIIDRLVGLRRPPFLPISRSSNPLLLSYVLAVPPYLTLARIHLSSHQLQRLRRVMRDGRRVLQRLSLARYAEGYVLRG